LGFGGSDGSYRGIFRIGYPGWSALCNCVVKTCRGNGLGKKENGRNTLINEGKSSTDWLGERVTFPKVKNKGTSIQRPSWLKDARTSSNH